MRFEGQGFLVTGAAGGLGRACALRLAAEGARVVIGDVTPESLAPVAAGIAALGGQAHVAAADVTRPDEVARMVETAFAVFGGLDGAVNCAGILSPRQPIGDYDLDLWDRVMEVNLRGVFLCCRAQIARLAAQGRGGSIVNVSSNAGVRAHLPGLGAYATSKHGVIGLTRVAARDHAAQGIRVNAVCPGPILTPMLEASFARTPGGREASLARVPMGRFTTPEEIAGSVAFLLSADAGFVTGHALVADGGVTI